MLPALLLLGPLTLAAETAADAEPGELRVIDRLVGWGHETLAGLGLIDTIILQSTYAAGDPYSIDGGSGVRDLWGLVALNGAIYRLVRDADIACHTGKGSIPDGRTVGPNAAQYDTLVRLVGQLQSEHPVTAILGHNDISISLWSKTDDPW